MTKKINVLDSGYIEYVDHMGSDQRIVNAARTSTGLDIITDEKRNEQLIRYLLRHKHTSPFEFCQITFKLHLPIFVMRQLIRHRTAKVNEVSGRYSELEPEFYTPEFDRIKGKGKFNKQGSEGEVIDEKKLTWLYNLEDLYGDIEFVYDYANKDAEIANELARISLPVAQYTTCYWSIDLHNLMHFLKLRMDSHAQWEIQVYAQAMYEIVKELYPITMKAFDEYILNSITLSQKELEILKHYLPKDSKNIMLPENMGNIEKEEFIKKIYT